MIVNMFDTESLSSQGEMPRSELQLDEFKEEKRSVSQPKEPTNKKTTTSLNYMNLPLLINWNATAAECEEEKHLIQQEKLPVCYLMSNKNHYQSYHFSF